MTDKDITLTWDNGFTLKAKSWQQVAKLTNTPLDVVMSHRRHNKPMDCMNPDTRFFGLCTVTAEFGQTSKRAKQLALRRAGYRRAEAAMRRTKFLSKGD